MDENTIHHHFVCSECGILSQHAGVCQTEGCMQEGVTLRSCSCEDGKHGEVMNRSSASDEEESSNSANQTVDLDQEAAGN
ncbi:MAG: hypothetical protein M3Q73_02295 [bacterium]|nr:hypothetical protein [bacterium]